MKVLTWNVNKAGESRRGLWEMLRREDADVVLLQEVTGIPRCIRDHYQCHWVTGIKLTNNRDLWFTEILWALLRNAGISDDTNWIVAGDFNSSVLFDEPIDTGNREIIERLNALGLTDCLSHSHRGPVPTFQHTSKSVDHQLDYCYVNAPMLRRLRKARVPNHEEVFYTTPRLSDHLPIVCEFN